MRQISRIFLTTIVATFLFATIFWLSGWVETKPLKPSGGIYFPGRFVLPVPYFSQRDSSWSHDKLGSAPSTLAQEGCAVTSASMVLAYKGMPINPKRLNGFLGELPGGYTPNGWIYWEKAAEFAPSLTQSLLPHYEDLPSYARIDWNLLRRNPVIVRLRRPGAPITHFVVIVGKQGFDYLILDPGLGGARGVYPLKDYGSEIEALRYYRQS